MKILIPIVTFGPQGGFRVLSELASHWILLGHDVEFLAHNSSNSPYFPTAAKIRYYDNDANCSYQRSTVVAPRFKILSILSALKNSINKSTYDVLLATHSFTALPVYLSKECDKKFYYIQAYEPEYYIGNDPVNIFLRSLSKLSYQLKLKRIVNSPLYFKYKGIKANKYVFPGIDFEKFKPTKLAKGEVFILGCIGRIEPFKGTSFVLDAFKELRRTGHDVELHIAFGDPVFETIPGIKIITIKNDQELAAYYNSVDVIIAPGTLQLGAVHYPVIEAMACKTPVITTGYYPADSTNSWLVPTKNSDQIVTSIEDIINNLEIRNEKVERAYLKIQEFDWKLLSKKMLEYFNGG